MGNGRHGTADDQLLAGGLFDFFHRLLRITKDRHELLFQGSAEVFIRVFLFKQMQSHFSELPYLIQREYALCHGYEDKHGNLVTRILFVYGAGYQFMLDIIGNHGGGDGGILTQRKKVFVDIPGCLLEIQSYIGNFIIGGETKMTDGLLNLIPDDGCHAYISFPMRYYGL